MKSSADMVVKSTSIYHLTAHSRSGVEKPRASHISLAPVIVTADAAIAAGIFDF